jgi:hypothetical protein
MRKRTLRQIFKTNKLTKKFSRLKAQGIANDTYDNLENLMKSEVAYFLRKREDLEEMIGNEKSLSYTESYLQNGIRIVTESPDIPNYSTMVFQFAAGSQFEDESSQGSSQVLSALIAMQIQS